MNRLKTLFNIQENLTLKQERNLKYVVNIICLATILVAIGTCVYMYTVNRSLWVDEAMLAYSVSQRSLSNLTSQMLDMVQSAPVIYLYIVKVIITLFGDTELTLRIFSFISYLLVLVLSYFISGKLLKIKYPIIPVAFIAGLIIMMRYANEFKPYMTDAMVILAMLAVYSFYSQRIIKPALFVIFMSVSLWFSNPVCFLIAAILLYEFFAGLKAKDLKQVKYSILAGVFVLASFIIYYFYWLKPLIDTGLMQEFWSWKHFRPLPSNDFEWFLLKRTIHEIILPLGYFGNLILIVIVLCVPLNIFYFKNKYINIINLSLFITLIVSWIKMYPIHDRMCLFFYPLFSLLFFFYLSQLFSKNKFLHVGLLLFSLIIVFVSAQGPFYYNDKENIYIQEMNMAVAYLEKEIENEDVLFIPDGEDACQYLYIKEYETDSLGYEVMFGHKYWWTNEILHEGDMEKLKEFAKLKTLYLLVRYDLAIINNSVNPILDSLEVYGNLECLYNQYTKRIYRITPKFQD